MNIVWTVRYTTVLNCIGREQCAQGGHSDRAPELCGSRVRGVRAERTGSAGINNSSQIWCSLFGIWCWTLDTVVLDIRYLFVSRLGVTTACGPACVLWCCGLCSVCRWWRIGWPESSSMFVVRLAFVAKCTPDPRFVTMNITILKCYDYSLSLRHLWLG